VDELGRRDSTEVINEVAGTVFAGASSTSTSASASAREAGAGLS
jgi:hypothetical protein